MAVKKAPAKKKAAKKSAVKKDDSLQARDDAARVENARKQHERLAAEREQKTAVEAADEAIKENDLVVLDVEGVPEALRNAQMSEAIRGLTQAGMHNRAGRVQAFEEGPTGRVAIVNGPDFTQRVPVNMLKRADKAGESKSAAKKKSAKK